LVAEHVDGFIDFFLLSTCAHGLSTREDENDDAELVYPMDEAGDLFWSVLNACERFDHGVQVDVLPKGG
jgi:hypothetical protein